ncbi:MAG: hypothetical protein ABSE46_23640 [Terracidiphilus sp.]
MRKRTVLEAAGASLLLLPYYLPFLGTSNLAVYHHGLPVTNLIGGLLVDLLGIATLAFLFLFAIHYLPAAIERVMLALFAGLMLWRMVDVLSQLLSSQIQVLYNEEGHIPWGPLSDLWIQIRKPSGIAVLLLAGILACALPRFTEPAVRTIRLAIAAFGFCALWIVPQLLHRALIHRPDDPLASLNLPAPASGTANRRIIWILFDELSYDQTFDHLAPGLVLPNFGRLRAESVSFSDLKPTGFYTERIIPSLFLDRRIDRIRSTVDGELWYKDEQKNRWLALDAGATLFGLAQRNGWSTGVEGFYNPYCHLLASVLNSCSWEPVAILPLELHGVSEAKPWIANAAILPGTLLAGLNTSASNPVDVGVPRYLKMMKEAQTMIEDSQIRFVFLHLPVPHPPGMYDRKRHTLRSGGNYLDNLALADDTLGTLLQQINATPSAGETTLVITSDHSWRIPIWLHSEGWTGEEERVSGGRFDDRPVLLVHFPGETAGKDVDAAVPELLEHDMIAGMLKGKINNPADLTEFVAKHGQ